MHWNVFKLSLKAIALLGIIFALLCANYIASSIGIATLWRPPVNGLFCYIATIAFVIWLGREFDRLWPVDAITGKAKEPFRNLGIYSGLLIAAISVVILILIISAILLFEDVTKIDYPFQPIFTFFLSGLWFLYVLYALSSLVSASGNKVEALSNFGKYSIVGAIALSIYFLLPFKWFADSSVRAFGLLTGKDITGLSFDYAGRPNDTVNWLQTTAIPSLVSIGFAFITAYVTSLTWYEYFKKMNDVGLREAEANRKGRDPNFDELWFGRLSDAQNNVRLSGVTLGGWFKNWPLLRKSVETLLAREGFGDIHFILPDPGASFFWLRRDDEARNQAVPGEDTIVRFGQTLERLYYMLSYEGEEADLGRTRTFMTQHFGGQFSESDLQEFFQLFVADHAGRLRNFRTDEVNAEFTGVLANKKNKVHFRFAKGMMLGANLFDDTIFFVPYLPLVKDKDCPQYFIQTNSPLGRSLSESINQLAKDGNSYRIESSSELIAMAFRLKQSCSKHSEDLYEFSEIQHWLRSDPPATATPQPPGPSPSSSTPAPSQGTVGSPAPGS